MRRRLIISVVLVAVTVAVMALAVLLRRPPEIPRGYPTAELAFISDRGGDWDIYLLDPVGDIRSITAEPSADYFPSWAFTSDVLNYLSSRSGATELEPAQISAEGGDARSLSVMEAVTTVFLQGRLDWDPQWTAGEDRIAWASLRDLNLEIYTRDGDDVRRLTDHPARDWFPAWSPDGTQLAFASDRDGDENLYVIDASGDNLRQLTDNPADDIRPVWSLDGTQILFVTERDRALVDGTLDLYIMNADGSAPRPLAEAPFSGGLAPAPDGTQAVFMANLDGVWSLYVLTDGCAALDCARRLTDDSGNDLFPVWRP